MAQLLSDAALERAKHMDDRPDERNSDLHLSEPKSDGEFKQVAGRESPATFTAFRILEVGHDDALLAQ